ncbi:glycosyltransferase family 4 protein [Patescibacteria group bacterium]|nr:glycosyltransferase family 4 protein [Patescibacteria group bacterium]
MKIGIDCRMFGPGFGLARYTQQLVKNLLEIDLENQYVLFFRGCDIKEFIAGSNKNVKIVITDIPWYSLAEQIKFKSIIKKQKIDLMHFPHWNVPLLYNEPFVVTVHDLIMYHYPRPEATTLGPIKFWFKNRMHRFVLNHAVAVAKHIIVTSEFTKQDVHATLGVELKKMTVTYQAPFAQKHTTFGLNTKTQKHPIDFEITKPYVLCVGAAYPHKNLDGLLRAWDLFEDKYGGDYQLVLVGKQDYFYRNIRSDVSCQLPVVFTGFVPDDELVELYKNASLYVFPSKYEGFGLPPLEAQQFDIPVASSSASCLPEVLGESALYFDPENIEQMADTIHRGLTDQDIRFELKQNARENLQRFSGDVLARVTLGVYNSII